MGKGIDSLRIVSLNPMGRNGKQFIDYRWSSADDIIGQEQPDIFLLPGDEDFSSHHSDTYNAIKEQTKNETVLLYDQSRLRIKTNTPVSMPKMMQNNWVCPFFEVMSPPPTQSVVKEFHCLTWHYEAIMCTSEDRYKKGMEFLMIAQMFALLSNTEILIGGDLDLPKVKLTEMVLEHNKIIAGNIEQIKPFFRQLGLMDEMTDNIMSPGRRLGQLKLIPCGDPLRHSDNPDFFFASKEMQLMETKHLETRCKSGKFGKLQTPCQTKVETPYYRPTKTEMYVPPRPPKHNGG